MKLELLTMALFGSLLAALSAPRLAASLALLPGDAIYARDIEVEVFPSRGKEEVIKNVFFAPLPCCMYIDEARERIDSAYAEVGWSMTQASGVSPLKPIESSVGSSPTTW